MIENNPRVVFRLVQQGIINKIRPSQFGSQRDAIGIEILNTIIDGTHQNSTV